MKVTIQQVQSMFREMAVIYSNQLPNDINQINFMINVFYERLKDKDSQLVATNFANHLNDSRFMPTISDLVKKRLVYENVPDAKETKLRINQEQKLLLSNTRTKEEEDEIKEILRKHKEKAAEDRYNEYKRRVIESKG